jgi:hypothetical protein
MICIGNNYNNNNNNNNSNNNEEDEEEKQDKFNIAPVLLQKNRYMKKQFQNKNVESDIINNSNLSLNEVKDKKKNRESVN